MKSNRYMETFDYVKAKSGWFEGEGGYVESVEGEHVLVFFMTWEFDFSVLVNKKDLTIIKGVPGDWTSERRRAA